MRRKLRGEGELTDAPSNGIGISQLWSLFSFSEGLFWDGFPPLLRITHNFIKWPGTDRTVNS